jgi:hypothetical protein
MIARSTLDCGGKVKHDWILGSSLAPFVINLVPKLNCELGLSLGEGFEAVK